MKRRTFVLPFLALVLSGCVSGMPSNLTLSSVREVNYRRERELPPPSAALVGLVGVKNLPQLGLSMNAPKPNRSMLRVEFTSDVNLPRFAFQNGYTLFSKAWFCDAPGAGTPEAGTIASPDIFWRGVLLSPYDPNPIDDEAAPPFTYYNHIWVDGIVVRDGREKEKQFYNLRETPRDVCLQVRGGKPFSSFASNTLIIPKEIIAEALGTAPAKR